MAENRGVFRLRTLRTENIQGEGVEVTDVWSPPAPIATADASYMVGGLMNNYNSSNTASDISSQTDKITYSTMQCMVEWECPLLLLCILEVVLMYLD